MRPYRVVAFARGALEPATVENADFTPDILDQAPAAQLSGGDGNRAPAHAKHVGQKFVRKMKVIRVGPVVGH